MRRLEKGVISLVITIAEETRLGGQLGVTVTVTPLTGYQQLLPAYQEAKT